MACFSLSGMLPVAEMSIGDDLRPVKWESYLSLVLKVG